MPLDQDVLKVPPAISIDSVGEVFDQVAEHTDFLANATDFAMSATEMASSLLPPQMQQAVSSMVDTVGKSSFSTMAGMACNGIGLVATAKGIVDAARQGYEEGREGNAPGVRVIIEEEAQGLYGDLKGSVRDTVDAVRERKPLKAVQGAVSVASTALDPMGAMLGAGMTATARLAGSMLGSMMQPQKLAEEGKPAPATESPSSSMSEVFTTAPEALEMEVMSSDDLEAVQDIGDSLKEKGMETNEESIAAPVQNAQERSGELER